MRRRAREAKRYKDDPKYRKKILAACKSFAATDAGRACAKRSMDKYKAENAEKIAARQAANRAVRLRQLAPLVYLLCTYCNAPAKHYHHYNGYAPEHWLDVEAVCTQCHGELG